MEDFYTGHDPDRWGKLLAEDGELFSVPDVVRVVMKASNLPHLPAAHHVLSCIRDAVQARCYITRPGLFALPVRRPAVWPVVAPQVPTAKIRNQRAKPASMPNDLAAVLRGYFGRLRAILAAGQGFDDADLYVCIGAGQLAMHSADVVALFAMEWRSVFGSDEGGCDTASPGALLELAAGSKPAPVISLVSKPVAVELKATKKPGERWAGTDEALLLAQFEHLRSAAGGSLKAYAADETLAKVWSVCESNVKQVRLRASRQANRLPEATPAVTGT